MQHDVASEIRERLGRWNSAEVITNRRDTQVWRVQMANIDIAVKVATADGPAGVLPAREAAVITAAGQAAGTVTASGRLSTGGSWLAVPWRTGPTLHQRVYRVRAGHKPVARQSVARAAADAARALARLHQLGWAHGDIQADHIIHTAPRRVHLLDLAWACGPHGAIPADLDVPYEGALVHLEAPEIAQALLDGAPATPTAQADVYALAGALWASWTGAWPVDYAAAGVDPAPGNPEAKRKTVASGRWRRTSGSGTWPDFSDLLRNAMAPHPADRPTAGALAEELILLAQKHSIR